MRHGRAFKDVRRFYRFERLLTLRISVRRRKNMNAQSFVFAEPCEGARASNDVRIGAQDHLELLQVTL